MALPKLSSEEIDNIKALQEQDGYRSLLKFLEIVKLTLDHDLIRYNLEAGTIEMLAKYKSQEEGAKKLLSRLKEELEKLKKE